MTTVRHWGAATAATPFPTLERRSIAVNTFTRQIAVGDEAAGTVGTPLPLIAVRFFDARASYALNDLVVNNGVQYIANGNIAPGAFNASQWTVRDNTGSVLKVGDTMTGRLTIDNSGNTGIVTSLLLDKKGGSDGRAIVGMNNQATRWRMDLGNSTAEGGTNTGSDFSIYNYNDAGNLLSQPMLILRNTGDVRLYSTTPSTSRVTGALTVAGGVGITGSLYANYISSDTNLYAGNAGTQALAAVTINGTQGTGGGAAVILGTNNQIDWWLGHQSALVGGAFNKTLNGWGSTCGIWLSVNAANGAVGVLSAAQPTNTSTGALIVTGGVGIGGNTMIGGIFHLPAGSPLPALNLRQYAAFSGGGSQYGICFRPQTDGTYVMPCVNAGDVLIGGVQITSTTTNFVTGSDARLKDDFKPFDAGHIIDKLKVYDFRWKSSGERAVGVVAQEAAEVYPAPVSQDEMRGGWFVDYSKYVPVLLQEMKSLRARVAELEA